MIRLHKDDAADLQSGALTPGAFANYRKPTGFVTVPVHQNYGAQVVKRLQRVVDEIFIKGVPPTALV